MNDSLTTNPNPPFRWWFLPSWLGLDAPCVVTIWTWAISRNTELSLDARAVLAMFSVVWAIYLSDRLIDVARCQNWHQSTGRLVFGGRYRLLFCLALALCAVGFCSAISLGLPVTIMLRGVWVALGVVLYFLLFVLPIIFREKLPGKEFGVGLFFALGAYTCLGATMTTVWMFVVVALLVAYNCLVIAAKDAASDRINDPGGASRWWANMNRDVIWLGVGLSVAVALSAFSSQYAYSTSATLAFIGLTMLHHNQQRFSSDAVRALADYALLSPIPIQLGFEVLSNDYS